MRIILFDTETTGLPKTREPANRGPDNWPHLVSIAWIVMENDKIVDKQYYIIRPEWEIPADSTKIHGITNLKALLEGKPLAEVMTKFMSEPRDLLIAHNMNFDMNVIVSTLLWDMKIPYHGMGKTFCTMEATRNILAIPFANGRGYKSPKLSELYEYVTNVKPKSDALHNALYDAELLAEIVKKSSLIQKMIGLKITPELTINGSYSKNESRILRI